MIDDEAPVEDCDKGLVCQDGTCKLAADTMILGLNPDRSSAIRHLHDRYLSDSLYV